MGKTIRIIFSAFALVMMGLVIWRVSTGTWSWVNWGMVLISALCCLLVLARFLYIFTYSYGLCAVLNAVLIWVARPSMATALVAGVLIIYGMRLLAFFWLRDRSRSYAPRVEAIVREDGNMPMAARLPLWFMVLWLMAFHLMSLWFVGESGRLSVGVMLGVALMLTGTLLEATADWQKQRSKSGAPTEFVTAGLFGRWRHPNFFGEVLLQVGLMVVGLSSVSAIGDGVAAVVAPLYIVILMVSECRRVDAEQIVSYGEDPAYLTYRQRSGSLLPKFGQS
jgi:steroid 5-alpha reductase family enzyme